MSLKAFSTSALSKLFGKACSLNAVVPKAELSTAGPLMRTWGTGWGYRRGPYLSLYDITNEGKRRDTYLKAHERFTRLEWGPFVRALAGRNKKQWKKSALSCWHNEQYVFCAPFHNRRLNRMFGKKLKHFLTCPDDPYYKYNNYVNFYKHKWTKWKNLENIRTYGNRKHFVTRWKAHLSSHRTRYNLEEKMAYEPPGYVANVAANNGIYKPEFIPEDTPAPYFERPPIRVNKRMKDFQMVEIKKNEAFYGHIDVWHPILKGMYKRF